MRGSAAAVGAGWGASLLHSRPARAEVGSAKNLIIVNAVGGWDTTYRPWTSQGRTGYSTTMDEVSESDAMPAAQFWGLIETSLREHPRDIRAQGRALRVLLADLSDEDLCAFCLRLEMVEARASCREHLWAAAYTIRGGCSDDAWDGFRKGLISRGRAVFEASVIDPDSLANLGLRGDEDWVHRGETWLGLEHAFTERTGQPIPHWGEKVRQRIVADIPADDPPWDGEENLAACRPRLFALHWRA